MHRLPIAFLSIVAVGAGAWLLASGDPPRPPEQTEPAVAQAREVEEVAQASPPDLVPAALPEDARMAVQLDESQPVGKDPCASLRAELEAKEAELVEAQDEISRLRKKLAEAELEIRRLKFPESTPYGAFLASDEARQIQEMFDGVVYHPVHEDPVLNPPRPAGEYAFEWIKAWLDVFPVFLRPGEATWIAERYVYRDGLEFQYGRSMEEALIVFLGPARLAAELPPERLAELREEYAEEGYFH